MSKKYDYNLQEIKETGTVATSTTCNSGFTCDACGRETQGCSYVNGMKFCAKCYQETFGGSNARQSNKKQAIIEELEKKLREDGVLFVFNLKEMSQYDATVRHQICEEIREWCEQNEFEIENADQSSDSVVYTYKKLFKKLDKIEKGE